VFQNVWIGIADTDAMRQLRLTFDAPLKVKILRSELIK
jgi:sRNA-binding carbon storage regulator CsrA